MKIKLKHALLIGFIFMLISAFILILISINRRQPSRDEFAIILNSNGTLSVRIHFDIEPEDEIYIYWETDAGNLSSNTTNERLLEIKDRYDSGNIGLFTYGTVDDVVSWSPFDRMDNYYYQTVTILSHMELTRGDEFKIFTNTITILYDNGVITETTPRRMGNPIRANGATNWVQVFPWSWCWQDLPADGMLRSNTFVIRTGIELDDDIVILAESALPIWESHPQVFGAPSHNGYHSLPADMTGQLLNVRLVALYFPFGYTRYFEKEDTINDDELNDWDDDYIWYDGEYKIELDYWQWPWEQSPRSHKIDEETLEWLVDCIEPYHILLGSTVIESGLSVRVLTNEQYEYLSSRTEPLIPGLGQQNNYWIANNSLRGLYSLAQKRILVNVGFSTQTLVNDTSHTPNDEIISIGNTTISRFDTTADLCIALHSIHDFTPLAQLHNLQFLTLRAIPLHIDDDAIFNTFDLAEVVDSINSLPNLRYLTISFIPLYDITPLSKLSNLYELTLFNTEVYDISPLASMTNLTRLFLNRNYISDLSPLSEMSQIETLNLSGNMISDITPLQYLTALKVLDLSESFTPCLIPLNGLSNLWWLSLNSSSLSDISQLSYIQSLQVLYIAWNEIRDVSSLAALTGLTFLNIENNPIEDWSMLEEHSILTLVR